MMELFGVTVIDEDRAAACSVGAVYIAPAIANKITFRKIDTKCFGRAKEHARFRLSAGARLAVLTTSVETDFDSVEKRDCIE